MWLPPACILSDSEASIRMSREKGRSDTQPQYRSGALLVKINLGNSVVAVGDMKVQRGQPIPKTIYM